MPQQYLKRSTAKVGEAVQAAVLEAANLRKGVVTAELVLAALFEQEDSVPLKVLAELGLDADRIRQDLVDMVGRHAQELPDLEPMQVANLRIAENVVKLLELADGERARLGDAYISTGTLFLACFDERVAGPRAMLATVGLRYRDCADALSRIQTEGQINQKDAESRRSALDRFTVDVTAQARRGQLDPVIGRDRETDRLVQILSRRKKNNPVLIGEPGVGKSVIVEGLAQRIVDGTVPEHLRHRRVLSLDVGSLLAGAKMQGEFEERLKSVKEEIAAAHGSVILFIDELHTIVGAGRTGGSLDASNMLKPALARGELQCIGATTLKEYKQHIESDKALERRFQPVKVEAPDVETAIGILRGLKRRYEEHHQVEFTEAAIRSAVELSERYLTDRTLPDKAIDLLDEAGAAKRMRHAGESPAVQALDGRRQELLNRKAQAFEEQKWEMMATYQAELTKVETELKDRRAAEAQAVQETRTVTAEDVAAIVSDATGIPLKRMVGAEARRLVSLESSLGQRVIGQSAAVRAVANAVRRNRSGLRRGTRPIASFLFLGPTGVGKTELAKALAAEVMHDETKIIQLDMSEYMERHEVAKLIGSPPGYVGYGEGGQLTEKVRRSPYSIVLFDEIEKAHPDVFNILLQLLDEGWLTDAEGNRVSFRNCIVIGTSNLGSEALTSVRRPIGLVTGDDTVAQGERDLVLKEVQSHLRPELINRLDEIIVFNRLGAGELRRILDLQVKDLADRLAKLGYDLDFTDAAKTQVLASIDTSKLGARPLRRKLEAMVENELATLLIEEDDVEVVPEGHRGTVRVEAGELAPVVRVAA